MCLGATKATIKGIGRGKPKELKIVEIELSIAERE
jgi:hypothetical protein